jgi:hypothetical protein
MDCLWGLHKTWRPSKSVGIYEWNPLQNGVNPPPPAYRFLLYKIFNLEPEVMLPAEGVADGRAGDEVDGGAVPCSSGN